MIFYVENIYARLLKVWSYLLNILEIVSSESWFSTFLKSSLSSIINSVTKLGFSVTKAFNDFLTNSLSKTAVIIVVFFSNLTIFVE